MPLFSSLLDEVDLEAQLRAEEDARVQDEWQRQQAEAQAPESFPADTLSQPEPNWWEQQQVQATPAYEEPAPLWQPDDWAGPSPGYEPWTEPWQLSEPAL